MQEKIRWGILGCGRIAHRFVTSASATTNAGVLAAASNTPGRAALFATEHGLDSHYQSYEELLGSSDIDAVYVANTHNLHHQTMKSALNAGKHVLCEKPFTVTAAEARDVVALAHRQDLFLMEGMWTRFLPAIEKARTWLQAGEIGEVRQLRADFGFRKPIDPADRLFNPRLAGGALLDAGIYPISFSSMVMNSSPDSIHAVADIGITGVDESSAYLFTYEGGTIALLSSAIRARLACSVDIVGSKGRIHIPPRFHAARRAELYGEHGSKTIFEHEFRDEHSFSFEIEAVSAAIHEGKREHEIMPLRESVALMETMDIVRSRIGIGFPE